MKAQREMFYIFQIVSPRVGLPDAVIFFTDGSSVGPLLCITE